MAKSKRITATVGPFVFAYPHLTAPDSEGKYADNKYKVDGVGEPNSPAMKAAKATVAAALKDLGLPSKGVILPLKQETAKDDKTGKRQPTGNLIFRAKSQYAPSIHDSTGAIISEKRLAKMKIGAGSEGLIQGFFSDYEMKGEQGMSFTLTGIQLVKLVSGGGGAEFGAYEGGGFTLDGDDSDDTDDSLDIGSDTDDSSDEDDGGLDI